MGNLLVVTLRGNLRNLLRIPDYTIKFIVIVPANLLVSYFWSHTCVSLRQNLDLGSEDVGLNESTSPKESQGK